jgi:hypothetical protein
MAAFFRTYLGGEDFGDFLTGDADPPASAATTDLHVSFHPPDSPALRRDVNRLLNATNLTVNTLGGLVTQDGFTPNDLCGGDIPQPEVCLPGQINPRQPHTTPSARAPGKRGLSQLRGGWTSRRAFYRNELPVASGDVSGYDKIQFRVAVNYNDSRNPVGVPQDFTVTLIDQLGGVDTALVSDKSVLYFPPGTIPPVCGDGTQQCPVPKVVLNTVRLPLFLFPNVDLTRLRYIELDFDQTSSGAVLLSDMAFAGSQVQLVPTVLSPSRAALSQRSTSSQLQPTRRPLPAGPAPAHRSPVSPKPTAPKP